MNLMKRSILYIVRKWKKTLLIFFLLFTVTVLVISGFAILDAQEEQTAELRGVTGTSFTVGRNLETGKVISEGENMTYNTQEFLSDEMIEAIAKVDGISAYNASITGAIYCSKADGTIIDLVDWGEYESIMGVDEIDSISHVYGCINANYHNFFTSGKFELVKGSFITPDSENSIIMNKQAAEDNGLDIGDTIKVTLGNGEPTVVLKIIGLFDTAADQEDFDMSNENTYFDYSQYSFIDIGSMRELLANYEDEQECDSADFFVSDPEKLESIIQEVQSISSINWNNYTITANDEVYQRVASSISDTGSLISIFIWVTVIVSMVIIVLLLSMWMRSRKWEIGILLAIGVSKPSIILQYILETLLIAIVAFPCGYLVSHSVAGYLGELFGKTAEMIVVTSQHFILVAEAGAVLLVLAILFSCIPILRYKPKYILSLME